jgi:hypothetical protein
VPVLRAQSAYDHLPAQQWYLNMSRARGEFINPQNAREAHARAVEALDAGNPEQAVAWLCDAVRLLLPPPEPVWSVGDRVRHPEITMGGRIERIDPQGLGHFVLWDNGARCNYDAHELRAEGAPRPFVDPDATFTEAERGKR